MAFLDHDQTLLLHNVGPLDPRVQDMALVDEKTWMQRETRTRLCVRAYTIVPWCSPTRRRALPRLLLKRNSAHLRRGPGQRHFDGLARRQCPVGGSQVAQHDLH